MKISKKTTGGGDRIENGCKGRTYVSMSFQDVFKWKEVLECEFERVIVLRFEAT
jgi:hypothetical protein